MGFGPFSSESTTRFDTTNKAFNTGFSDVAGAATSLNLSSSGKTKLAKGASYSTTVNFTDQGAINAAQEIASQSLRSVELFGSNLTSTFEGFAAALRAQGNDAIAAVSEANRTELENIGMAAIKWGALAIGGYFILRAITSGKI